MVKAKHHTRVEPSRFMHRVVTGDHDPQLVPILPHTEFAIPTFSRLPAFVDLLEQLTLWLALVSGWVLALSLHAPCALQVTPLPSPGVTSQTED
jgi:hypothetical protein